MTVFKCRKCNTKLLNLNWSWFNQKYHSHICNSCYRKWKREWAKANYNAEKREYNKLYNRKHYVGTSTGFIRGNKRDYPKDEKCEICKRIFPLIYHHWNDEDLSKGLWICRVCHLYVEQYEKPNGRVQVYINLKARIENES